MATGLLSANQVDYTKELNTLYKNTFGRDADASGVSNYASQLASGRSLGDIRSELESSDEYRALQKQSSAIPTAVQKPVAQASAVGYTPTMQTVSDKSTVQNQLANITGIGSALNTQAETAATKQANRRGLLSSSIAVGAAQDAVTKNALPVAQQDASTYANTDTKNAEYGNAASQFKANAENSASQFNANAANQLQMTAVQADVQKRLQQIQSDTTLSVADKQIKSQQLLAQNDNATKLQLQSMDTEAKKSLAAIDAQYKQQLQTNISAANAYAQLSQNLANISSSKDMDQGAKQQATDNQIALFRQTLQALGQVSNLDLSKYFETDDPTSPSSYAPSDMQNGQALAQRGVNAVVG